MTDREITLAIKRLINCPKYYKLYIDSKVDLMEERQVISPFRVDHDPSLTYDPIKDIWRDWPAGIGGDVVTMHMYNLNKKRNGTIKDMRVTRQEAIHDLARILQIDTTKFEIRKPTVIQVKEEKVKYEAAMNRACRLAETPEDYLKLDYIMSQHRPYVDVLDELYDVINDMLVRKGGYLEDE